MTDETPGDGWQPVTPAEAGLVAATDPASYLAALRSGPLLLPVGAGTAAGREPFAWPTADSDGQTHVLAFTSPQAIAAALPDQPVAYVTADVSEVVSGVPEDTWWLAVNPGLPIAARFTIADLKRALPPPVGAETAEQLRSAIAGSDPDALMSALLRVEFTVPLHPDGGPATDLSDPDFRWWCVPDEHGRPAVPVFTSPALLREVLGHHPYLAAVRSPRLVANWPDPDWQLAVDPGTTQAVSLPGSSVREVGQWLAGLRQALAEDQALAVNTAADVDTAADVAGTGMATTAMPLDPGGEPRRDDDGPDPDVPVRMQVLVPHRYLQAYVTDGYDRVAGVVHRWYGPGRDTPDRLYDRLGLLGPASPYSEGDEWVPVVRWSPSPDTPAEWLVAPARQRSLAVPDRAELRVLHADGGDELLACFDAESRRWLPPPDGGDPNPG
ncbi:SseB family protein [Solwaraspora sp. WMMB335]|uniref:SseB family protein n=1 Tax=Solwaraspora sp. WMMB335 TaxID=3404118 RepID=UPI003B957FF7